MSIAVKVKGLDKLKSLGAALGDSKRYLQLASADACEESLNLISEGFKSGTDPYGVPWSAPNELQITGGIKRYARGRTDAGGFSVHSTDQKAIWHHDPQPRDKWHGKSLPTRLQVPTKALGLPAKWHQRLAEAMEDVIAMALRRAAKLTG